MPSEAELNAAREHRDQGWLLIRRAWLDGADIGAKAGPEIREYGAEVPLPDAFEAATTGAEGVADRLWREAHRVHQRADQELRPAQRREIEAKADADRTLAGMGGDDAAAVLADEAQQLLAALRAEAERYVRVKLAARILRDEIEHFRRAHSAPVLRRSSAWFRQLTNGAFSAVETDFDDSDEPVLVARRRTGERLRVAAMSTGTPATSSTSRCAWPTWNSISTRPNPCPSSSMTS